MEYNIVGCVVGLIEPNIDCLFTCKAYKNCDSLKTWIKVNYIDRFIETPYKKKLIKLIKEVDTMYEKGILPTKEEYKKSIEKGYSTSKWSRPVYLCPKCKKGGMCRDTSFTYASLPPKYDYMCNKCRYTEIYF